MRKNTRIVLALAAGMLCTSGVWAVDTDEMPAQAGRAAMPADMGMTAKSDGELLAMMIAHEEAGVRLANAGSTQCQMDKVRDMAKDLSKEQTNDLKELREMARKHPSDWQMPAAMMEKQRRMGEMMKQASGPQADQQFLDSMIAHHQAGIRTMQNSLANITDGDLKDTVEKMIKEQKEEVTQLQELQQMR